MDHPEMQSEVVEPVRYRFVNGIPIVVKDELAVEI